jgi:hypothetical protein
LSRIMDNKHHPTDVLAGSILGSLLALFSFFYLTAFYKKYNFKSKYNSVASNDVQLNEEERASHNSKRCCGTKVV